jgi:hypothetical protein
VALDLNDEFEVVKPVHSALDVVDGVVYVAVRVSLRGCGVQEVILTSAGEAFTSEQWQVERGARGLFAVADVDLRRVKPQ